MTKINFASYGTPRGYCSNGGSGNVGEMRDERGHLYDDNSNRNGVSNGTIAGAGAGGIDGTIFFSTGFCHSTNSTSVVEAACKGRTNCRINVTDATFGGNPCYNMTDSKIGTQGMDDSDVQGTDAYPRGAVPYAGEVTKRLFVQATCESTAAFAANCFEECEERGQCLYGLAMPHCSWCTTYGLTPTAAGGYTGEGCGSAFCVKHANCALKSSS